MSKQMDRFQRRISSVGARMHLNAKTPDGLFEASNGNRYVIAEQGDFKAAIALAHAELPPFTWHVLSEADLEYGRFWGPWRLRLTDVCAGSGDDGFPDRTGDLGDLMIGDRSAAMMCRCRTGEENWITIGLVGDTGFDVFDYSGWAFETVAAPYTFFEKSPASGMVVGYLREASG